MLWSFADPDAETYSMPTAGYFVGNDSIPDFFVCYAVGTYPNYERGVQFLLDGATGRMVEQFRTAGFTYASPLTVDINNDGYDDVLLTVNDDKDPYGPTSRVETKLVGFDFKNKRQYQVSDLLPGANFAITPYVGDLDHDGDVDVLYGSLAATTVRYPGMTANRIPPRLTYLNRRELPDLPPKTVRWGAYMGERGDAVLRR